ncbi:MAG: hypothetical protein ABIS03_03050 [Gemmatimonadaceae bacterium]
MTFLFWLALVIGGGLLLLSLIGDHGSDVDHDISHDAGHGGDWGKIFSLRYATYFLFAFGATGTLLQLLWKGKGTPIVFIIAALTGAIAWGLSAVAFNYLKRTDTGDLQGDRWLIGRTGTVTLPLRTDSTGKIQVRHAGQIQELLARPHDESEEHPEQWDSVMIVEIRDGIALVAPSLNQLETGMNKEK